MQVIVCKVNFFFYARSSGRYKIIVGIYETIRYECEIREGMIKKEAFAKIDLSCKYYHVYLGNVSF